jgi:UDP-galactopyranose mutase
VLADIYGKKIPVPFNLNSLYMVYDRDKAERLEKKLVFEYGMEKRVTISELRRQTDDDLQELASFIYNNVFLYYTQKQWGVAPEDIDPAVTARVPVLVSYDNRYFQDTYQGIPAEGYTPLFEKMLDHPNINKMLNTDSSMVLKMVSDKMYLDGKLYHGTVVYTGALDELYNYCFGRLPYRTLDFVFENHNKTWYQQKGTINYTVDEQFTRITEFKHMTGQNIEGKTAIAKEYPREYTGLKDEIPYYAILNPENIALYDRYKKITEGHKNFYLLGRLAEYKYYNMDTIVERALLLADSIIQGRKG